MRMGNAVRHRRGGRGWDGWRGPLGRPCENKIEKMDIPLQKGRPKGPFHPSSAAPAPTTNGFLLPIRYMCGLALLLIALFLPTLATAHTIQKLPSVHTQAPLDFPAVDPNYIYGQLFYMVTHFQHREAGYDTNLPVSVNGHDEFADYWAKEMVNDLQGFGPQIRRDPFSVGGWQGRPALTQAFNVEMSIPGVVYPEQVVVIGCHYDGEAVSTQSANDDGSGCAIELGVAKAMGTYWKNHHSYPARTLRFVIFDAEEQGLYGSFHYLNSTVNGDVSNIVAMFNEEQNGIAYPLRYLGQLSNPLLPLYIDMSPLQNNRLYAHQSSFSQAQRDHITRFRSLILQAIAPVFQQFQALGYTGLTYHTTNKQDVVQPIFSSDQMSNVQPDDDIYGGSDQIPFTLAGVPCATYVGNASYYGATSQPAYPYDQAQDTIQLMNTYADGSSQKSNALMLALALPCMLTTWMLHQPDILGEGTATTQPITTISDIGLTQVGQSMTIDAATTLQSQGNTNYSWDFGDGTKANGVSVSHTYQTQGKYTLTLTVSSAKGTRTITKQLSVVAQPTLYDNPYRDYKPIGRPPTNTHITLPIPNDALTDKVVGAVAPISSGTSTQTTPTTSKSTGAPGLVNTLFLPFVVLGVGVLVVIAAGFLIFRRKGAS